MKNLLLTLVLTLLSLTSAFAADLTLQGTISKVVPEKKEIYVIADGKKHEFYFKENTELTQNGAPAEFSALKVNQTVKVGANKVGKRLEPVSVEILK